MIPLSIVKRCNRVHDKIYERAYQTVCIKKVQRQNGAKDKELKDKTMQKK